jgi:hypothetical protein
MDRQALHASSIDPQRTRLEKRQENDMKDGVETYDGAFCEIAAKLQVVHLQGGEAVMVLF